MIQDEIEAVARAFYQALEGARGWDREPEGIKDQFRKNAQAAIEAVDEFRLMATSKEVGSLIITGDFESAREYLMHAPEVSVMPISNFRSVRRGPTHVFDAVNEDYYRLFHFRELLGMPVREALPELKGQSYYELMDHVYETKRPFVGCMLPILVQAKRGGPLEEHIIDFVYRPIEDPDGKVLGIFVEGYDRTRWARAE